MAPPEGQEHGQLLRQQQQKDHDDEDDKGDSNNNAMILTTSTDANADATNSRGSNDNNVSNNQRKENPYSQASIFSKLFFTWPYDLLKTGMERTLEEEDIPKCMEEESSSFNLNAFETIWNKELKRVEKINERKATTGGSSSSSSTAAGKEIVRPNLHRALLIDYFKTTWIIQPLLLCSSIARITMALGLGWLVQAFIDRNGVDAYTWSGVLVFCNAVVLFEHHHVFLITSRKGMNLRTGSVAAIFSKCLRLSGIGGNNNTRSSNSSNDKNDNGATDGGSGGNNSDKNKNGGGEVNKYNITSGQIMNLVSNDVERYWVTSLFISYAIWAPLQTIAIFIIGIYLIGPAFAVGMTMLLFIFVPAQVYLSKKFAIVRSKVAHITDSRVTMVSQAINGVRVMKMSGWEQQFEDRIHKIREREVKQIRRAYQLYALNESLFFSTNVVISLIIFAVHVAMGGQLKTSNVFIVMSLTNILQIELAKHFSIAMMSGAECFVSVRRIQKFLELPELSQKNNRNIDMEELNTSDSVVLSLQNISCFWDFNSYANSEDTSKQNNLLTNGILALDNINIELRMNELTCIVGPVGSGKSALLYALAGELVAHKGTIRRQNHLSLAFATQDPWIMNGSVKDNILMGLPFDEKFYGEIVNSVGLDVDFKQFMNGDETIVGDRGVQCSGGQRARIGLARALYRKADVLLLDDPLSAVDSRVGALIFYSAIQGIALKNGACVILVTHQHQFIGDSRCILMTDGKISADGSFDACVAAANGRLHSVTHYVEDRGQSETKEKLENVDMKEFENGRKGPKKGHEKSGSKIEAKNEQEEKKFKGEVSKATFVKYARSMGGWLVVIWLLLLFAVSQAVSLACIAMIGRWSERSLEEQKSWDILITVFGLGFGVVVLAFVRSVAFLNKSLHASKQLHNAMTSAMIRAKIEFFDTNPSGRILNRFSADVGSNDELLPKTWFDFFSCGFIVLGSMVTAITALPYIIICMPPLLWYFMRTRNIFVTSTREIKRWEGLARSPIFAMISESISGVSTIRCNDASQYMRRKFQEYHDAHCRAYFGFVASSRWVGFRMDTLMFLTVGTSSILAALFSERGWFNVDPVIFGLALSMLMQLGSIFQWTIRQSAEVVNQMVCVERVSEYSELEPEAPLIKGMDKNLIKWPNSGDVSVKDLSIRYRSTLPLSLQGVSFEIKSGQRIGVVGRTGSGKSTLVQSLFRLLEAEEGSIMVDGIDISTLGLHRLRRGMSVINQYPVLFSGCTVRENLDPFEQYGDETIIEALTDVQMIEAIDGLSEGMHSIVAENGSNFSVGERQLLCLARAILQKSRILVLDEPTANVDSRTDQLLQDAVNKSFPGATIISVAHRLDTIIDNDFILVLGGGEVLEYGTPADLIGQNGHFTSMVNDTGREMSGKLRRRALGNS